MFLFGYLIGGLPALFGGLVVGGVSGRVRGKGLYAVALVTGFVIPALPCAMAGAPWSVTAMFGAVGAVSGLACTALAGHAGLGRVV